MLLVLHFSWYYQKININVLQVNVLNNASSSNNDTQKKNRYINKKNPLYFKNIKRKQEGVKGLLNNFDQV